MGKTYTNVIAELMAVHEALLHTRDKPLGQAQAVIPKDSLIAFQRIQGEIKDAVTHTITQEMILLVSRAALQWLPAHCQVHGNEVAHALAKSGGRLEQVE